MSEFTVDWLEVARRRICGARPDGSRFFKSILKLDKNFHVYVHGNRKNLQVQEDENGTYLKLYFKIIK